jgi:hypothetical protein
VVLTSVDQPRSARAPRVVSIEPPVVVSVVVVELPVVPAAPVRPVVEPVVPVVLLPVPVAPLRVVSWPVVPEPMLPLLVVPLGEVVLAGPPDGVPGPWVCVLLTLLVPPPVPEPALPACAKARPVAIASAADAAINVSFFMG